jgi:hypothetical protein
MRSRSHSALNGYTAPRDLTEPSRFSSRSRQAIPVRTDYTAGAVRRFAQRAKDAAQTRQLSAIAAVLDGASREEAATARGYVMKKLGKVLDMNSAGKLLFALPVPTESRVSYLGFCKISGYAWR